MTSPASIAVVGAGVFGAWAAEHLRRRGHRVTLVDMAGPAHERASSGGESRLTRASYGADAIYSQMAIDSLPDWKALSARAGLPIFHPCGILFFFGSEEPYFLDTVATHQRLCLPTEVLDAKAMGRRFPMIDFDGISVGLYEPGFGALMARRAVQTLVAEFVAAGGIYRRATVQPFRAEGDRLTRIDTSDGPIDADAFVFALGPWLPSFFRDLLARKITPTRQEVFFFAPPAGSDLFDSARMPGWSDFNGGDMFYGFPDLESRGVKFAFDRHGEVVDPETQSRMPSAEALATVVAYRDRRFPALRDAPLVGARVCQYENSSNGDFLIDRHPALANVVLVGGGSGHGFKHGPEVGRRAADLALSNVAQSEPRFSLVSKGEERDRAVH